MDDTLNVLADLGLTAAREREPLQTAQPRHVEPRRVLATAEVECHDGATLWHRDSSETVGTPAGEVTRVRSEQVLDRFDPEDYEPVQPEHIPVLHRHDRERRVGRVEYLQWIEPPAKIVAVFSVDEAEADFWAERDVFISPGTKRNARGRLVLDHVGLVGETARIAASAVQWSDTTFARRCTWTRQTTVGFDLLRRAHDACRKRARAGGIPIVGHPGRDAELEEERARPTKYSQRLLLPDYMRSNGDDGVFYSGGVGKILRVW